MQLAVLPGDDIGPEITVATLDVLAAVKRHFSLDIGVEHHAIGLESLKQSGATLTEAVFAAAREADGIILGPVATAIYPPADKGGINPSAYFRKNLDLYANIRPARTFGRATQRVSAFDLVVVRENTEGFYADRNMTAGDADILVTPDVAIAIRKVTREASTRIAEAGFRLARARRRRVTLVHKANVLKRSDGLFLDACRAVAADYPDVNVDDVIIDAMTAHLVRDPGRFDVIVTTNMFGDILSDLAGELAGSLGLAGALNAGATHAVAQATHGSAPDIAGQDRANPMALIRSLGMLLHWLGERHGAANFIAAGRAIEEAVGATIAAGETTPDLGGRIGTKAVGRIVAGRVARTASAA
ncbi:MAG: isocitrate/isopropylmalate dehydrogenase family protein [Alphaproteobacteria bacterium]|nr:isocitrate/isopropylmalate dehydrogenase family protein [Alphaproteobacteria bacterium]